MQTSAVLRHREQSKDGRRRPENALKFIYMFSMLLVGEIHEIRENPPKILLQNGSALPEVFYAGQRAEEGRLEGAEGVDKRP